MGQGVFTPFPPSLCFKLVLIVDSRVRKSVQRDGCWKKWRGGCKNHFIYKEVNLDHSERCVFHGLSVVLIYSDKHLYCPPN